MSEYRIRWALVDGTYGGRYRVCIAEKLHIFLWVKFWLPLLNGRWCTDEASAQRDIEHEINLLKPLPPPRVVNP